MSGNRFLNFHLPIFLSVCLLLTAGLFGFNIPKAQAAVTLTQSTSGGFKSVSGTATTLSLDFGSNTTAGNAVVIEASFFDATDGVLSATVGSEGTPTKVSKTDPCGTTCASAVIFYVCNITGGSKTVTLNSTDSAANTFISAIAYEFTNVASSCLDSAAITNSAQSTSITTTAYTPLTSGDVIFAMLEETNGQALTVTWASSNIGFENPGTGQQGSARYKILTDTTAQTATATFTSDGNNAWATVILGLKPATAAATPVPAKIQMLDYNAIKPIYT